jgi:H+/gluconate symporter-like permease
VTIALRHTIRNHRAMWGAIGPFVGIIIAVVAQLLLMRWFWRRMKRVQRSTPAKLSKIPPIQRWQESVGSDGEHSLQRASDVSEDLLKLGAKARESRWPLNNE